MITIVEPVPPGGKERIRQVSVPLKRGGTAQIETFSDGTYLVYVAAAGASFFWHLDAGDAGNLAEGFLAALNGQPKPTKKRGAK